MMFLKKFEGDKDATLKISATSTKFIFGRLFAGIENSKGEFSSNHSFYDNSKFKEYHDSSFSIRTYPFFKNKTNAISMYPIMSKSKLDIEIQLKNSKTKFLYILKN